MECKICGNPIPEKRQKRYAHLGIKTCSLECAYKNRSRLSYRPSSLTLKGLNSATVGAISELKVTLDLMEKGFEVFRAITSAASCDLAILRDSQLLRIEVRTGYRNPSSGTVNFSHKGWPEKADIMAVVLPDGIIYDPPFLPE